MFYVKAYLRAIFILLCMFVVIGGILFIISNVPGAISRMIVRHIFTGENSGADGGRGKNRHLIRKIEWIRYYPLKKMILSMLWLFCVFICVTGTLTYRFIGDLEDFLYLSFFYIVTAGSFVPVIKYISRYRCLPYLNRVLSKSEIDSLMEKETFEQVLFSDEFLNKYVPIFKSKDWLVVCGMVISRKLSVMARIDYIGVLGPEKRFPHVRLEMFYMNGQWIKVDLGSGIYGDPKREKEIKNFFQEETGCLDDFWFGKRERVIGQIVEKYGKLLPEFEKESEKIRFLLQSDTMGMKKDIFPEQ